ncbi:MAG: ribosome maturation factor RimM [Steroidobacteraceae bacterium]|nr:ribosome maturation factor RimM [Steroidobacteraceae bacterium]MDW8258767.1 ribosome maturation factor RimM [Gammaproteobacteria bacterium]
MDTAAWVELGRLGKPFGLEGWLHCHSYTDPPEQLLRYRRWRLTAPRREGRELTVLAGRPHGRHWIVRLETIGDVQTASALAGRRIWVARAALPALPPGQHYRSDLIGLRVVNRAGVELGRVAHFVGGPAQPVMAVRGTRERWLPAMPPHLWRVDPAAGVVWVDWPEDF